MSGGTPSCCDIPLCYFPPFEKATRTASISLLLFCCCLVLAAHSVPALGRDLRATAVVDADPVHCSKSAKYQCCYSNVTQRALFSFLWNITGASSHSTRLQEILLQKLAFRELVITSAFDLGGRKGSVQFISMLSMFTSISHIS